KVARPILSLEAARENRARLSFDVLEKPAFTGLRVVEPELAAMIPYIDWTFFFHAWELKGRFPAILDHPEMGAAARELYANPRDPGQGAGGPPGRSLRRVPARGGAAGLVRTGPQAGARGAGGREVPRHPPGIRVPGLPRPQREGHSFQAPGGGAGRHRAHGVV